MSYIVGIVHLDSHPADANLLAGMISGVANLELDAWSTWCEGRVGLGQLSSKVIPQTGAKPALIHDPQTGIRIAADIRIDNVQELRAALSGEAARQTDPDHGHLLLQAYLKWGPGCVERLAGDFAFALWDPGEQRLICGRDPMGVRPFYYHQNGAFFAFASDLAPILDLPRVPKRLNELRVADYLVQNFEDKQITFYEQVFRLPPGHILTVDPGGMTLRQYWRLDPETETILGSDQAYAEAFFELFQEAVRSRLNDRQPAGSMLSGGLDSSSITCVARDHLEDQGRLPLHTFSAIFPGVKHLDARIDESRYMKAVIETGGLEPHYITADDAQPLAGWMWEGHEPVPAPNIYMDLAVFEAARKVGIDIVLSGFDGDSTVSYGFEHMAAFLLQGKWPRFYRETISLAQRFEVDRKLVFWRLGIKPLMPGPALRMAQRLRGKRSPYHDHPGAIAASFAERVHLQERMGALSLDGSPLQLSPREQHRRAITSGLLDYALSQLHTAGKVAGVEPRYPFFDRRLIEFSLSLPASQKLNRGWTRYVLRNAMAGILPEQVRWRSGKSNLSVNFKQRLKAGLQDLSEESFAITHANLQEYVDQDRLRRAYRRFSSHVVPSERDALTVFLAVVLSRWLTATGLRG